MRGELIELNNYIKLVGFIPLLLLILSMGAPLAYAQAQEPLEIDATMTRNSFRIEFNRSGYSENLTGVNLDLSLTAGSGEIQGMLNGWLTASNLSEASARLYGYMTLEATNTTLDQELYNELELNFEINSTVINPDMPEQMLPTKVKLITYIAATTEGVNVTSTDTSLKVYLNISGGLQYVLSSIGVPLPVQGDFALWLNLTSSTFTNMTANHTEGDIGIYLDFETGNTAVDGQLAAMIAQFLPMFLTEDTVRAILESMGVVDPQFTFNQGLDPADPSVVYIEISYSGHINPAMIGSITGVEVPTQNITELASIPAITPLGELASLNLEWELNVASTQINDTHYNVTFDGGISGNYTLLEEESSQGSLEVQVSIHDGNYDIHIAFGSSYESPITGILAIRLLLEVLNVMTPQGTPITVNFNTQDVAVLDTSTTPPTQINTLTVHTQSPDFDKVRTLGVSYDNTIMTFKEWGLYIVSDGVAVIDLNAASMADNITAEAPGVEIKIGTGAAVTRDLPVSLKYGDEKAEVTLHTQSILNSTVSMKILDRGEAESIVGSKYNVIGTPLEGAGLINGTATIRLKIDYYGEGVKVLKITDDGQIIEIQDVEVGTDYVEFTTNSFSKFIPVVEKTPTETTTTTTTTETTTTKTTRTTTETTETTTETTETTTTTPSHTTTTETTETTTTTTTTETTTETTRTTTTETSETTTTEVTGTTTTKTTTTKTTETTETTETPGTTTSTQPSATTKTITRTLTKPPRTTTTLTKTSGPGVTSVTPSGTTTTTMTTTEKPGPVMKEGTTTTTTTAQEGLNKKLMIGVVALIIIALLAVILLRR